MNIESLNDGGANTLRHFIPRAPLSLKPRTPRPHGHQFLRRRGMHRHGRVEVRLGGAHLHGDAQQLRHFAGVMAQDMDAQHLVGGPVNHDLHDGLFRPAREGRLHRAEAGAVDVHDV